MGKTLGEACGHLGSASVLPLRSSKHRMKEGSAHPYNVDHTHSHRSLLLTVTDFPIIYSHSAHHSQLPSLPLSFETPIYAILHYWL